MDIFKLGFETTVVGLLAFLWIAVASYLLFPAFVRTLVKERLPAYTNQTLLSVATQTAAYCLGSAILPVSNQLVTQRVDPCGHVPQQRPKQLAALRPASQPHGTASLVP